MTNQLLESALRIRNAPEFKEFREWLDSEQALALKGLVNGNEQRAVFCAQGAYIAFQRIKDLIESAPTALDKKPR